MTWGPHQWPNATHLQSHALRRHINLLSQDGTYHGRHHQPSALRIWLWRWHSFKVWNKSDNFLPEVLFRFLLWFLYGIDIGYRIVPLYHVILTGMLALMPSVMTRRKLAPVMYGCSISPIRWYSEPCVTALTHWVIPLPFGFGLGVWHSSSRRASSSHLARERHSHTNTMLGSADSCESPVGVSRRALLPHRIETKVYQSVRDLLAQH